MKKYLTPQNIFLTVVFLYFVIQNERKMVINTGPDPATIQFEKDLIKLNLTVESLNAADKMLEIKIKNYAKIIIENNRAVDGLNDSELDSLFQLLANG